jgi:hypothetical protein
MKFLFAVLLIPVCGFASAIVTIAHNAPTLSGSSVNSSSLIGSSTEVMSSTDNAASAANNLGETSHYRGEIKTSDVSGAKLDKTALPQGQSVTSNGIFNPAPEPGSLALIGVGLVGLAAAGAVKAHRRSRA